MDFYESQEEQQERLLNRCALSKEGDLCGIDRCSVPPEMLCCACDLWYCVKHIGLHYRKYKSHKVGERSDPSEA